jgi:8-oxo-dGTP diphosphatase
VPFTYEFPRPAVAADSVLFVMRPADLAVLLVKRKHAPYKGAWALPGGFVNESESLERAAARELMEETGITGVPLEQVGAFGEPGRDPRGHIVSAVFYSFLVADVQPVAADDAADAAWKTLRSLPLPSWGGAPPAPERRGVKLAFDHGLVIDVARRRLQERLVDPARQAPFEIVPARFTLTELQRVYEAVLGRTINRRVFRSRLVGRGVIEPVARTRGARNSSASDLYRFKPSGLDPAAFSA